MDKQLIKQLITGDYQVNNPLPDVNFRDYVKEHFEKSKCDYCNSALHDCSLCGVLSFDTVKNGEPIC